MPCNRESRELVARFNPAYPTDTMKPGGAWHGAEGWQDEFDLHFHPHGRYLRREDKHPTLANVYAVSSVVMVRTIGPAE